MMTPLLDDAQHFVRSPDWTWYILGYFFFAGLSGGSYFLASFLRLFGKAVDEPAARLGYYVAFPALLPCPVLLTLDLGQPLRFYHMLFEFKWWSPMSVGAWALVIFGAMATASFAEVLVRDGKLRMRLLRALVRVLDTFLGKLWALVGALFGLFIAGYTGVLLSVSNQPVWSDTWALGGLFLASGLSGAAALIGWLIRFRHDAEPTAGALGASERMFQVLELVLIGVFAVTLIPAGAFGRAFGYPWILLWLVAWLGIVGGLGFRSARPTPSPRGDGTLATTRVHTATLTLLLVLLGVLALRAAIIFSAQ